MVKLFCATLLFFLLLSCNHSNTAESTKRAIKGADNIELTSKSNDKEEIQNLIRKTLKWATSSQTIELLPMITDRDNKFYIRLDLKKHKGNLDALEKTGFFSNEFINNYNQIILILDKKIRNENPEAWHVGELPPFNFANDANPWTLCQDVPYDTPSPWDYIEVDSLHLNKDEAAAIWKWGNLDANEDPGWKKFSYKFKTRKENGKWRITYLQGFDKNIIL